MTAVNSYKIGLLSGMEPVKSLVVPLGWSCEFDEPNFNSPARSISYFPAIAPDAVLMFFNRGYPVGRQEADKFRELIAHDQIELNVDSVRQAIPLVLGNLSDGSAFEITSVGINEINGRRTLMVEGTWLSSAKRFHGYLLPADTTSGAIQEIFFEGVEPDYSKFLPIAQRAINSIKWSG